MVMGNMGAAIGDRPTGDNASLVFVSYSRRDAEWQRKFVEMLEPVARQCGLEVWSDDHLRAGDQWHPQLVQAIGRSRAAVLLVSQRFLESSFIIGEELPALRARPGIVLFPVLLRPCNWRQQPLLAPLQFVLDTKRSIVEARDPRGQISQACLKLLPLLPAVPGRPRRDAGDAGDRTLGRVAALEATGQGGTAGEISGVPELPSTFVARRNWPACAQRCSGLVRGRWG